MKILFGIELHLVSDRTCENESRNTICTTWSQYSPIGWAEEAIGGNHCQTERRVEFSLQHQQGASNTDWWFERKFGACKQSTSVESGKRFGTIQSSDPAEDSRLGKRDRWVYSIN